jgi:hypothetical protein
MRAIRYALLLATLVPVLVLGVWWWVAPAYSPSAREVQWALGSAYEVAAHSVLTAFEWILPLCCDLVYVAARCLSALGHVLQAFGDWAAQRIGEVG